MIRNVKSRNNIDIASDFNAKTGTATLVSNIYTKIDQNIRKGKANSNCDRPLELVKLSFIL